MLVGRPRDQDQCNNKSEMEANNAPDSLQPEIIKIIKINSEINNTLVRMYTYFAYLSDCNKALFV